MSLCLEYASNGAGYWEDEIDKHLKRSAVAFKHFWQWLPKEKKKRIFFFFLQNRLIFVFNQSKNFKNHTFSNYIWGTLVFSFHFILFYPSLA